MTSLYLFLIPALITFFISFIGWKIYSYGTYEIIIKRVLFVLNSIDINTIENLLDFKEDIYKKVDSILLESKSFKRLGCTRESNILTIIATMIKNDLDKINAVSDISIYMRKEMYYRTVRKLLVKKEK